MIFEAGVCLSIFAVAWLWGAQVGRAYGLERNLTRSTVFAAAKKREAAKSKSRIDQQTQALMQLRREKKVLESAGAGRNTSVITADRFPNKGKPLTFCIGHAEDSTVEVWLSFTEFCHLVVGGQTNGGKTVAMHSLLIQLLARHNPKELQLAIADFKRGISFRRYNALPHMLAPTAETVDTAAAIVSRLYVDMQERLEMLTSKGFENLVDYNQAAREQDRIPYTMFAIDETQTLYTHKNLVNLSSTLPDIPPKMTIKDMIGEMAEKSRAAGIYLVSATQLPNATTIPQKFRANCARLAFKMATYTESNSTLGTRAGAMGADQLRGQGHALLKIDGELVEFQGMYISTEQVELIIEELCETYQEYQQPTSSPDNVVELIAKAKIA